MAIILAIALALQVSGTVTDSESGDALTGVHVFLAGTSVGSTTGTDGAYRFSIPQGRLEYELIASMIGYEVVSRVVSADSVSSYQIDFRLTPKTYELDEIGVSASNEQWLLDLQRFKELVFSTTPNAEECIIHEPEQLNLSSNPRTGLLTASTERPFSFSNNALGYDVTVHAFSFAADDHTYRWAGFMQFTELEADGRRQRRTWDENREKAWRGSARHFLSSLAREESSREGFHITSVERPGSIRDFRVAPDPEDAVDVVMADPRIPAWELRFNNVLAVTYVKEPEAMEYRVYQDRMGLRQREEWEETTGRLLPRNYRYSWLMLNGDYMVFDREGNEYGAYSMQRSGYWAWERLCDMMPAGYRP
ncbi:MAG: carboxypeptidase-like regulatory domain-containing protein [Rhodothermales bacterium]